MCHVLRLLLQVGCCGKFSNMSDRESLFIIYIYWWKNNFYWDTGVNHLEMIREVWSGTRKI